MSMCTVNGRRYEGVTGLETWGQLLVALEQGDGPARPLVTGVRFRGVDQPSFREAPALGRRLGEAAPVDVDTCAVGDLIASAVQTALDCLEPLIAAAKDTAAAFRGHDLAPAHRGLAEFVATLRTLATLTAVVGDAAGPADEAGGEAPETELLERLRESLESLIAFDTNEDWVSVADVLEYDMAELLPRWTALLQTEGRERAKRPGGMGESLAASGSVS